MSIGLLNFLKFESDMIDPEANDQVERRGFFRPLKRRVMQMPPISKPIFYLLFQGV